MFFYTYAYDRSENVWYTIGVVPNPLYGTTLNYGAGGGFGNYNWPLCGTLFWPHSK
jgi:hypothetical protein